MGFRDVLSNWPDIVQPIRSRVGISAIAEHCAEKHRSPCGTRRTWGQMARSWHHEQLKLFCAAGDGGHEDADTRRMRKAKNTCWFGDSNGTSCEASSVFSDFLNDGFTEIECMYHTIHLLHSQVNEFGDIQSRATITTTILLVHFQLRPPSTRFTPPLTPTTGKPLIYF